MDDATATAWEFQLAAAVEDDAARQDGHASWVPPIMQPLVLAAMHSNLRRLAPFTSHNLLRFRMLDMSEGLPNLRQETIAPAFVAVVPEPDRYVVIAGQVGVEPWDIVLETADPTTAVDQVVELLIDWR
jgi:hypothetical protein